MGESTGEQRSEQRERAKDAHRRLLEEAAERGSWWRDGEVATRVDRVIVGGGLAATLAWATRSQTKGTCFVLARAEEPWWSRREHRLGQPASELVSEGFVLQPHAFADDIDGFAPASALADAIAVTAHAHEMPLVLGCCVDRPIERTDAGRFVVHVGKRRIEAEHVDVAVGPGPARRLRDADGRATIVSEADEHTLLADGRMVFGQDQWQQPVRPSRVLVIGGGATAAWNVEVALRRGAEVTWVAPAGASKHIDRLRLKAQEIARHLEEHPHLERERQHWLERMRARIVAFRGADLPRNREVFRTNGVEWWTGSVERLRPQSDGVEAVIRREGRDDVQELQFDQVVVAIGQDEHAPEAAASLVRTLPVTWLEHDGHDTRPGLRGVEPSGRIIGACFLEEPPRLRCLGALLRSAAWKEQLRKLQPPVSDDGDFLEARLELQARSAPKHSKGIDGAAFQVSANVVLANGTLLDPLLGQERHDLLTATCRSRADQTDIATSRGDGG